MSNSDHWDRVYGTKGDGVSWYRPTLHRSLAIIDRLGLPSGASVIDVGSGSSTLADDLLERRLQVTVADLSAVAIDATRVRLRERASEVRFLVGDITDVELPAKTFDLWHDRAVFHFLTEPAARAAYIRQVLRALRPGGYVVVATSGLRGPDRCSGLPVARYDDRSLHTALGVGAFRKLGHEYEVHKTPWGAEQEFVYCYCRCETC